MAASNAANNSCLAYVHAVSIDEQDGLIDTWLSMNFRPLSCVQQAQVRVAQIQFGLSILLDSSDELLSSKPIYWGKRRGFCRGRDFF
jgi:hypothetical protein